jgi:hypothetical protein
MPIYDLSYRHWSGPLGTRAERWLPIAWAGLGPLFKKRSFIFWLVLSWIPAVVAGVMVYFFTKMSGGAVDLGGTDLTDATAGFFHRFYDMQLMMYLLTSVFVGSGLIANDRRTNALQIYLSKAIRPVDYLLGKGLAVAGALLLVTLGPGMALVLLRVGLDQDGTYLRSHGTVPLSILAGSLLIVATLTIFSLTVSSFTKSGRTAGVILVMAYLFAGAFPVILNLLFGRDATSLLSPISNLRQGLDWMFGQPVRYGLHPAWNLLALAVMLGICLRILLRRVQPVEIQS